VHPLIGNGLMSTTEPAKVDLYWALPVVSLYWVES
jgi:hypothetical protein